jgi:hypothetical protein
MKVKEGCPSGLTAPIRRISRKAGSTNRGICVWRFSHREMVLVVTLSFCASTRWVNCCLTSVKRFKGLLSRFCVIGISGDRESYSCPRIHSNLEDSQYTDRRSAVAREGR